MLNRFMISIFVLLIIVGTVSAQSPLLPGKLAIYDGLPSNVNELEKPSGTTSVDWATDVFDDYDIVVFGGGMQNPLPLPQGSLHPEYSITMAIITNLRTLGTEVYGYVSMSDLLPQGPLPQGLLPQEIMDRITAWYNMGVAGIFFDEAGSEYGVPRSQLFQAALFARGFQNPYLEFDNGLNLFFNASNPDDIFDMKPNGEFMPLPLAPSDIYLLEGFQIADGSYQPSADWKSKSDKVFEDNPGMRIATVTTVSEENSLFDYDKFDYAWWSTLLYGFDFMGWGEPGFSELNDNLPYYMRPVPSDIGNEFMGPVAHYLSSHTRPTTNGTIHVDSDTHTGGFIADIAQEPVRAVWMYGLLEWDNSTEIEYLSMMNINQVFLSLDTAGGGQLDPANGIIYDDEYTDKLEHFITQAGLYGISIHAMTLEDSIFTLTEKHEDGLAQIESILAYCDDHPNAAFDGIHIDVEPHDRDLWLSGDHADLELLLRQYVALLGDIRTAIDDSGLSLDFSASIAWWYNEQAYNGELPSGDAELLTGFLDVLVPMVYDDAEDSSGLGVSFEDIEGKVEDENSEARTIVGVGAHKFGTYPDIASVIAELDTKSWPEPANYGGTCVFKYATLKELYFGMNEAPVAEDDPGITTEEGVSVIIDVLANDTDEDGDSLRVGSITQGTHGSVVNNVTDVTYTPNDDYNGPDSFTYTANDGITDSNIATVNITVSPVAGINVSGQILVRRVSNPLLNTIPLFSRFSSQLSIRPVTLLNIDGSFIFVSLRLLLGSVVKHSDSTISGSYSLLNVTPDVEYTRSVTPLLGGPPWTLVSAEQVTYDPEEDVTDERIYVRSGTFMILCPVELHVYNSDGEHTGANDTGIPLSLYDEYEDIKSGDTAKVITIINPDDVYQIKVVGIDDGTCNLLVSNYITVNNEDFLAEIYLEDIPVSANNEIAFMYDFSKIEEDVNTLAQENPSTDVNTIVEQVINSIDSDGDGTPDVDDTDPTIISAIVDVDPDTLNVKSSGKWITAYIEVETFDISNIDIDTVKLEGVSAEQEPSSLGDHDSDGIPDLMVKFDGGSIVSQLDPGDEVILTVTGEISGFEFVGRDTVKVIRPGKPRAAPEFVSKSELGQCYPNPSNPEVWIPYQLSEDIDVTITIHNASGRLVRILDLGHKPAGFYATIDKAAYWDGRNKAGEQISSGIYFYTIQAGDFTATKKMVVAR